MRGEHNKTVEVEIVSSAFESVLERTWTDSENDEVMSDAKAWLQTSGFTFQLNNMIWKTATTHQSDAVEYSRKLCDVRAGFERLTQHP